MKTSALLLIFLMTFSNANATELVLNIKSDPWCPFSCSENEKDKGVVVEIAEKILSENNIKINYKNLNWARAVEETLAGKHDGVTGCGKPDGDFVFPDTPQALAQFIFYKKKGSPIDIKNIESLENKKIAVINGYTYDTAIQELIDKSDKRFFKVSGADPLKQIMLMVQKGRSDLFYEEKSVFNYYLKNNPNFADQFEVAGFLPEATQEIFFCLSKKNPKSQEIAKWISLGMQKLKKSGELNKILKKYGMTAP